MNACIEVVRANLQIHVYMQKSLLLTWHIGIHVFVVKVITIPACAPLCLRDLRSMKRKCGVIFRKCQHVGTGINILPLSKLAAADEAVPGGIRYGRTGKIISAFCASSPSESVALCVISRHI